MGERALFWPRTETLLIADPHWGKAAAFRAYAMPIPDSSADDLTRLDQALARTAALRLVVLGDLIHAQASRTSSMLATFSAWRVRHSHLSILLVRGNHDQRAGDPPDEWQIQCVDAPHIEAPFVWQHQPTPSVDGYALAGHLHPGARLIGAGRQNFVLPCFWFGARVGVLPAFGGFTGQAAIRPKRSDRVFVVVDEEVISVS